MYLGLRQMLGSCVLLEVAFQCISNSEWLDIREQIVQAWLVSACICKAGTHKILDCGRKPLRHSLGPILIQDFPAIQLFKARDVSRLQVFKIVVLSFELRAYKRIS